MPRKTVIKILSVFLTFYKLPKSITIFITQGLEN